MSFAKLFMGNIWKAIFMEKRGGYDAGGGGWSPITYQRRGPLKIIGPAFLGLVLIVPVLVALVLALIMAAVIDSAVVPTHKGHTTK